MRRLLQLATLLLLLPSIADAQVFSGQAVSASGRPIPFAQVTVCNGWVDVLVQNPQQSCNGQQPLTPPVAPTLAAVAAAAPVAGTYQVVVTYVNGTGETVASVSASVTTSGGNLGIQVTSPAAFSNATSWNAYFTVAGGTVFYKQNTTPVLIGTNYTQTAAINTSAANPPTQTTATNAVLPLAAIFSNVGQTTSLSNPFSADGNGRWTVFGPLANYTASVSAPGYTTYSVLFSTNTAGSNILGLNNTFTGNNIFNGTTALNGGGNISGTFTGAPTLSGLWTFNAGMTSSGPNTLNGGGAINGTWSGTPSMTGLWSFNVGIASGTTPNPASAGLVRLTNADSILWRNSGNTADFGWASSGSANGNRPADQIIVNALSGTGVVADSFASRQASSTVAASGVLRLGAGDTINFRNAGNTADVTIGKNGSDQITMPSGLAITGTVTLSGNTTITGGGALYGTYANGNNSLAFSCALTFANSGASCLNIIETSASGSVGSNQLNIQTLAGSIATPLSITQGAGGTGSSTVNTITATGGAGGPASGVTAAGNAGGSMVFTAGNGSAGGATSGTGGNGGSIQMVTGSGGAAQTGSTGGHGGDIILQPGAAGAAVAAARPGQVQMIFGTAAGSVTSPFLSITGTWNTTGLVDAAILVNITNTASGGGTKLLDLQTSGTSQFAVDSLGKAYTGGTISIGMAATLTGTGACATITTQTGGAWAGSAKCTGTTGAATLTIAPGAVPNGYVCDVWDETTRANQFQQTSHNTSSCTLTATSITQNDVFVFKAVGF